MNALSVDSCQRLGILFEDLVASCELVNSSRVQVQVTGVVPTIAIDKCDGVQVRFGLSFDIHVHWPLVPTLFIVKPFFRDSAPEHADSGAVIPLSGVEPKCSAPNRRCTTAVLQGARVSMGPVLTMEGLCCCSCTSRKRP